ncbi:MAG: ribonuclease D [Microthrixaceae bacterium]
MITDDAAFGGLVEQLASESRYAIDTEFHRERTYYPHVALVQIADSQGVYLVDALEVDLVPMAEVLHGDGVAVMHASRQDMEVLDRACAAIPSRLFDTQLAAGFVGYTSPSLAALLDGELGVRASKGDRLTDWLKRPLTGAQLSYAADDVAHLLALHDTLVEELEHRGRLGWVEGACEDLRADPPVPRDPDQVWRRIKEIRHLKGSRLAVAQAVAAWRERKAESLDVPPRQILSDLGVVSVASANVRTVGDLKSLRGVDGRVLRNGGGEDLLEVIARGRESRPAGRSQKPNTELAAELRPVLPLISTWVNQRAKELDLEASILATRNDIEELLRGEPTARLSRGWRAEIVGEPIRRLVSGEAALAFDHGSGLVLVER